MAGRGPRTSALTFFGGELRRLRGGACLSQEQLGQQVGYTGGMIGMIETARRMPQFEFAEACDKALDTGGLLARVWDLVKREATPAEWFEEYLDLEGKAADIHTYEPHLVPGVFQTEDYTRAVARAARPGLNEDEVNNRVAVRMTRQETLFEHDPPRVWAILDEAVLLRCVGNRRTMRDQLGRLLHFASMPTVTLQVLTLDEGASPAMGRAFITLRFEESSDVVYLEELTTSLYLRDDIDDVNTYAGVFDHLRAMALPESRSTALIADKAEEWSQ